MSSGRELGPELGRELAHRLRKLTAWVSVSVMWVLVGMGESVGVNANLLPA